MPEHPEPDVVSEHERTRDAAVQQAVEAFVEGHSAGKASDPMIFALSYPVEQRSEILAQCREFLMFDGLLGHQEWQDPEPQPQGGRTFGDFLIEEELGRGGMGIVYLAKQKSLDRRVALKVMASGLTLSKRHVERFRREAMATAQLHHPAIVPVHSLVEVDGTFALAMDYVAGRNLADMLDDLRLGNREGEGVTVGTLGIATDKGYVAECAMLVAEVASALAVAHHHQVVHRDLKPRNLMIDDRRQVRLLDFGLAKSLDATRESLSMSGEITGTAHYMSPEQTLAKRVEVDHRADIWSLGVILYELLTLQRPFDGKNLQQIVYGICFKEPIPLQRRNAKVPRDLVTICQKALEKDPQKRYQTAVEFEDDLQRFLRWEPIHAKPASPWTRASKFLRRHRTESVIAGTVLLIATVVLTVVWTRNSIDARQASLLLQRAETRADVGDYAVAITLTNQALELRYNAATRERLERYHADNKRIATEAAWKVAESKQLLDHDREGALLLALEAEQQLSSAKTRSAVLDALGSGWAARTLPVPAQKHALVAAWSPSGQHIVTGGYGGSLQYFASDNQERALALVGHHVSAPVVGVAFVGEDRLISVSPDRTLRLWWPGTGSEPRTLQLGNQAAAAMRTSQDGTRALIACYNSQAQQFEAQVWDTIAGTRVAQPVVHDAYILAVAISADGKLAATCCGARSVVRIWHTHDGSVVVNIDEHASSGSARELAFSRDGSLCAIGTSDGYVRLYDTATGTQLANVRHSRAVTSIAFDSLSQRLLTGSRDQTARLWQLDRDGNTMAVREVGVLIGHTGPVQHVGFDATDELAVTATGRPDGTLRIFDVGRGRSPGNEAIHRYEVGESIESAMFARDSRRILAVANKRTLVWNFGAARGMVTLRQSGRVPAIAFTNDDTHIVTAGDDEQLRLWHTRDGRQVWATERLGNPIKTLDIDRIAQRIATSDVGGLVRVHAIADGRQQFTLRGHDGDVPVVRFLTDGTRLLTAGSRNQEPATGTVIVWNLAERSPQLRLDLDKPIIAGDVNRDGTMLVTVEAQERVARLWSLPELDACGVIGDHQDIIRHVKFSPDGTRLLTASRDQSARIYTLTGERIQQFNTGANVRFATFSPDGQQVLTCSVGNNGTAQLWRTADGSEVLHFNGHRSSLVWGTFSSTGAWAATSARDGTTCIWPTDPVAIAKRLPLRSTTSGIAPATTTASRSDSPR